MSVPEPSATAAAKTESSEGLPKPSLRARIKKITLWGFLLILSLTLGYVLGKYHPVVIPGIKGGPATIVPLTANLPPAANPRPEGDEEQILASKAPASSNAGSQHETQVLTSLLSSPSSRLDLKLEPPSDREIELYRESVRQRPNDPDAHRNLGAALYFKGDLNSAVAEFRKCIDLRPGDPSFHNDLGVALYQKGDQRAAMDEFNIASRLDPNRTTNAWYNARRTALRSEYVAEAAGKAHRYAEAKRVPQESAGSASTRAEPASAPAAPNSAPGEPAAPEPPQE